MSHVATINLHITDLECLREACQSLGLELREGQKTYRWYGTSYGTVPEGFTRADLGKCDHAIVIPDNGMHYDIGVCTRKDGKPGFTLLWDFWAGGFGMEEKVGKDACKLKQAYAEAVTVKTLRKQGYRFQKTKQPDGTIKLIATK